MKTTILALIALVLTSVGYVKVATKVAPIKSSMTIADGAESSSGNGSRG